MAKRSWIGNAKNIKGTWTITIAGTWLQGDTITLTIGDVSVVVVVGTSVTPTNVATLLKEGVNNGTLSDTTASCTPAAGGVGTFGEFYGLVATSAAGVVTITGTAGELYELSVAKSSTSGTVSPSGAITPSPAPTGKYFWDNTENWKEDTVPVNGDDIVFDRGNVPCKYNIDTAIQPASVRVTKDYSGFIGLKPVNKDVQDKHFREYRQAKMKFTANAGTTYMWIGEGSGQGSSMLRFDMNDVPYEAVVYGSNAGLDGMPAVMFCDDASQTANKLDIFGGHVGLSYFDDETGRMSVIRVANTQNNPKLEIGREATLTLCVISVGGGICDIFTDTVTNVEIYQTGGVVRTEAGTYKNIYTMGGTHIAGQITVGSNFEVGPGGVFDCESDLRAKTITPVAQMHANSQFKDRNKVVTFTAGFKPVGCGLGAIKFDVGANRTFTVT